MGSEGSTVEAEARVQDGSPLKASVDAQGRIDVYDPEGNIAAESISADEARRAAAVLLWAAVSSEATEAT